MGLLFLVEIKGIKMKRVQSSNSIFALTALVLLISFISPLITSNSWFTSKGYNIQCEINIGANIAIYQNIGGSENDVTTSINANNVVNLTFTNSNGESVTMVEPDEQYGLNLLIKNNESAATTSGLRFKIQFYACGATNELLNASILGFTSPTSTAGGFAQSADGWVYYQNNSGTTIAFASNTTATILTHFSIPYADFYAKNLNGNNLKMILTIENATTGIKPASMA